MNRKGNRRKSQSRANRVVNSNVRAAETKQGQSHRLSIAAARLKAFEDSEKAQQARIAYAEQEAQHWYDYRTEE